MATRTDTTTGTITLTSGSAAFTTVGTNLITRGHLPGDEIYSVATGAWLIIETITGENTGTLRYNCPAACAGTGLPVNIRFQADGSRVSAQARNLIDKLGNGNIEALSGLTGAANYLAMFTGPGAMSLISKAELISGIDYDVQVADLAARATHDGQVAGFTVLVSDVGDGRAALYSKLSATPADWSAPAYFTGPVGAASTVPGIVWRGAYSGATLYAINDGVTSNGSSFRKLTTAAAGTAPSSASPPVNTTHWEVLAAKGTNGAGDVSGPSSSLNNGLVAFDGTTGKILKAADPGFLTGTRNRFRNGKDDVNVRPTPATIAAGGTAYINDRWVLVNGTNQTANISIVALTVGALDKTRYAIQANFATAPTTGTMSLVQLLPDLSEYANQDFTLTGHFQAPATTAIQSVLIQRFGTGGSPSGDVTPTPISMGNIGTSLSKISAVINSPTISGKVFGTSGDYLWVGFTITPRASGNYIMARRSLVPGDATAEADPFGQRRVEQEISDCAYFTRTLAGLVGIASNTTSVVFGFTLGPIMRIAPTPSLLDTSIDITDVFGANFTSSGSTVTSLSSNAGGYISITGFTGLTAGRPYIMSNTVAPILLSAEV